MSRLQNHLFQEICPNSNNISAGNLVKYITIIFYNKSFFNECSYFASPLNNMFLMFRSEMGGLGYEWFK